MTQIFQADGRVLASTVVKVEPQVVTALQKQGDQTRVQLGLGVKTGSRASKAGRGLWQQVTGQAEAKSFAVLRQFKGLGISEDLQVGGNLTAEVFQPGDQVVVSGISKGKGFQGVVKRHGFHGGPRSHGQKHSEREPGSIGVGGVQRVRKGMRMAGRMGSDRISVKNLEVLQVSPETQELFIKGAVPGRPGTLLEIVLK